MSRKNDEPPEPCPYCGEHTAITQFPSYGSADPTYAVKCFSCMYTGGASKSKTTAQRKHDALCRRLILIDDLLNDLLHPSQ